MRSKRRIIITATLGLVLSLALAGCSGSSSDSSAPAPGPGSVDIMNVVMAAAAATTDQASARIAFEASGLPGTTEDSVVRGEGGFDFTSGRGRFSMDLGGVGGATGQLEALVDGPVLYVRYPQLQAEGQGGIAAKPWLKLDVSSLGGSGATGFESLMQAQSGDPLQALSFLQGATEQSEEVGRETLRGEPVTHFRTVIDPARLARPGGTSEPADDSDSDSGDAGADGAGNELAGYLRAAAEQLGDQLIPADVWVDGQGRIRKVGYSLDLARTALGSKSPGLTGTQTTTFELFDYGAEIDVAIPPADQVTDLMAMLGQVGASGG